MPCGCSENAAGPPFSKGAFRNHRHSDLRASTMSILGYMHEQEILLKVACREQANNLLPFGLSLFSKHFWFAPSFSLGSTISTPSRLDGSECLLASAQERVSVRLPSLVRQHSAIDYRGV